jgi:penicillin-binding protein 1C
MIEKLGVSNFEEFLINLGFNSITRSKGISGAGLALGNAGVSLEELVRAFSVFPNGGVLQNLRFINKNENAASKKDNDASQDHFVRRVMSEESAWIISDILSDRGSRFTGFGEAPVFSTEFTSIFKTGTANQFQHIWALGATSRFTVGVWLGNFSGETVVGRTGSSVPAQIAADLLRVLENSFVQDDDFNNQQEIRTSGAAADIFFPRPAELQITKICTVSGMRAAQFCANTLDEWINPQRIPAPCSWHNGFNTVYPPEYQAWLRERFRGGSTASSRSGAYIRLPVNGAVFYFDASVPPEAQALRIETVGFNAEASVYCDDVLQGNCNQAGVFALPLNRGRHRIVVEDENNYSLVQIEVR